MKEKQYSEEICPNCNVNLEIIKPHDGGCSCHLTAPCSWCADEEFVCEKCDFEIGRP